MTSTGAREQRDGFWPSRRQHHFDEGCRLRFERAA